MADLDVLRLQRLSQTTGELLRACEKPSRRGLAIEKMNEEIVDFIGMIHFQIFGRVPRMPIETHRK